MHKKRAIGTYIAYLLGTLGPATVISLLLRDAMAGYADLPKPPLAPSGWLFPAAWSILYVLMAISAARVHLRAGAQAVWPWYVQLALNFLWTPVFFALHCYWAAFVVLVLLFFWVMATALHFARVDVPAAALLVPYLLWLLFAGYLNLAIAILA